MNPLLLKAAPYLVAALVAFGAGFSAAWYIYGVRYAALKNAFQEYQNEQVKKANEAQAAAQRNFDNAVVGWAAAVDKLKGDKDAYARCVASGRCLPNVPSCPSGGGLSAPGGNNVFQGGGAVPTPPGPAIEGLIEDCRNTQLKLNQARAAVRAQPGYKD